jgi:hypothetical protein
MRTSIRQREINRRFSSLAMEGIQGFPLNGKEYAHFSGLPRVIFPAQLLTAGPFPR